MAIYTKSALIAFALAVGLCAATEYHVSPSGDDNADGLTPATAWRTIHTAINRVDGGDTVWIHDGTYRGRSTFTNTRGSASAPITIAAYPGATPVLKGSTVFTNWIADGGLWYTPHATNAQQVFMDEQPLIQLGWPNDYLATRACSCGDWFYLPHGYRCTHIPSGSFPIDIGDPRTNMPPGSFYFHKPENRLYVRLPGDAPPSNHVMEVSTALGVFYDESPVGHLRVRGLTFRHANTLTYTLTGWPLVLIGLNGIIEDCVIEWGDASGLTLRHNSQALRCIVRNNGMLGIACNAFTNMLVRGCTVVSNNYRSFGPSYTGGIRFIPNAGATVEDNEVAWNNCVGIWFDTNVAGHPIVVRNNYVHNNFLWTNRASDTAHVVTKGIFIEFTENAHVLNNLVVSNAAAGIFLSASRNCRVENNLILGTRGNPGGHRAYAALIMENPQPGYPVVSNRIVNNLIVNNQTDYDVLAHVANGQTVADNFFDHNLYHRGAGAGTVFPSSPVSMALLGVGITNTFAGWKAMSGWDANSLTNAPALAANWRPLPGSPAIDAGLLTAQLAPDYDGRARPADGNADGLLRPDIGPFEYAGGGTVMYVDSASTNPVPPYSSWTTAATNPADAIAIAPTGALVSVRPGHYFVDSPLVLNRAIALAAVGPREDVRLDGASNSPIVHLLAPGAIVNGFTLLSGLSADDGGAARVAGGAMLQNTIIRNSRAVARGGGVFAEAGAILNNLHVAGCEAEDGGGMFASAPAELTRIELASNRAARHGGGLHLSGPATGLWLRAVGNAATNDGGGLYLTAAAVARWPAVISNRAARGGGAYLTGSARCERAHAEANAAHHGGGVFLDGPGAVAMESRLLFNQADGNGGGAALDGGLLLNSLLYDNTASASGGGAWLTGGATGLFITAFANAANEGGGAALDGASTRLINSVAWSNTATVAGTEDAAFGSGALALHSLAASAMPGTNNLAGNPLFRNSSARDLRLQFGSPAIDAALSSSSVTNDIEALTRAADGNGDGVTAPDLGAHENHQLRFVDKASPTPTAPYVTWSTAARTPQDAVSASANGDHVWVAGGIYTVATITVNRGLTMRSVAGPEKTVFDGNNGARVLNVMHGGALVEGFTLRRGRADAGAGAYVSAGKLARCIIVSNTSIGALGGNFAYNPNISLYYCRASYDSVIHEGGGGVAVLHGGIVENCLIYGNTAVHGGGAVSLNGGALNHVTLAANAAATGGGWYARSAGSIRNSILYHNPVGSNYVETGTAAVWSAVTAWPLPPGPDASDADPLFVNPAGGNFELADGSPAIDTAFASPALVLDLLGRPRPLDGDNNGSALPDRGAFERIHPQADTDSDGVPDANEWIAGTGLTNAASFLEVRRIEKDGGDVGIAWPGVQGRLYSIWVSTNLQHGFHLARTNLIGASAMTDTLTGYDPARELFIAVSVENPPL